MFQFYDLLVTNIHIAVIVDSTRAFVSQKKFWLRYCQKRDLGCRCRRCAENASAAISNAPLPQLQFHIATLLAISGDKLYERGGRVGGGTRRQ